MNEKAVRIQFTWYGDLIAEVIVQDYDTAIRVWSAYACAKYKRYGQSGGAVLGNANLMRHFTNSVGSRITRYDKVN